MRKPKYVVKIPGDPRLGGDSEYVEDKTGDIVVFEDKDSAVQHLIDSGIDSGKIENAKIIESIGFCRWCGSPLFPSDLPNYTSQCFVCDEDFYSIEQETRKNDCSG